MDAVVLRDGKVMGWKIKVAASFGSRLRGLIGRGKIKEGEGLLLLPCRQVHTWFMSLPIDIIFLAPDGEVVAVIVSMNPWRVSPSFRKGVQVLELPGGTVDKWGIKTGDYLKIVFLN